MITKQQFMGWEPCERYSSEYLDTLFAGRESLSTADIAVLDIPNEDKIWALLHLLDDGQKRLFACWCVRQVWHLLPDERSKRAVEVAERYAIGKASKAELSSAQAAAWAAAWDARDAVVGAYWAAPTIATWANGWITSASVWGTDRSDTWDIDRSVRYADDKAKARAAARVSARISADAAASSDSWSASWAAAYAASVTVPHARGAAYASDWGALDTAEAAWGAWDITGATSWTAARAAARAAGGVTGGPVASEWPPQAFIWADDGDACGAQVKKLIEIIEEVLG